MERTNMLDRKLACIPRNYSPHYLSCKQFLYVSVVPNTLLKFATFPKNLLSFSCDSILPYIFLHNHLSQSLLSITIDYHYTLAPYTIARASKLAACRVQGAETTMFTKISTYLLLVTQWASTVYYVSAATAVKFIAVACQGISICITSKDIYIFEHLISYN